MRVEVLLDDTAAIHGDFLMHHRAHTVDDGALHHVLGSGRVDDLRPYVGGNPHFIDTDLLVGRDRYVCHLGDVAGVAEVERHAHALTLGQLGLAPVGDFGDLRNYALGAFCV